MVKRNKTLKSTKKQKIFYIKPDFAKTNLESKLNKKHYVSDKNIHEPYRFSSNARVLPICKQAINLQQICKKTGSILQNIRYIYNLRRIKNTWFNNYIKKEKLNSKKNLKQKNTKFYHLLTFFMRSRWNKKKRDRIKKKWYYYNENVYNKKSKLTYYQNNFSTFYNNKNFCKFFLNLPFCKKLKEIKF